MLIKKIMGFKIVCHPVLEGYLVVVSDGYQEKKIPLLPNQLQIEETFAALSKTEIDGNISLEYFSMVVAGCLMTKMKRSIGK